MQGRPTGMPSEAIPASFRRLLVAWAGSLSGDGLRIVALPLLAASIDPSASAVATVAVASTLPWLLVAIPAGALIDRLNPARVMTAAHLARALATACLPVLYISGSVSIAVLAVFGFVITSAETFADGSAQSLLVRLVPSIHLERANARFVTVETVALDMAGPLAAGVLFLMAPWLPFAVSALCFLVAATTVATIKLPAALPEALPDDEPVAPDPSVTRPAVNHPLQSDPADPDPADPDPADPDPASPDPASPDPAGHLLAGPDRAESDPGPDTAADGNARGNAPRRRTSSDGRTADTVVTDPPGAFVQIKQGLQRLVSDPVLRVLVLTVSVMVIANAAADAVLVLYATQDLGMSGATYPLLLVAYSVGTLTAAALVGRTNSRLRGGQTMIVALFGISAAMLALGLFPYVGVALAAWAVMGLAGGTWNVLSATRRQRRTPRSMVARVSSAFRVVAWGVIPIGAALGGVVGERWSVPAVFVLAGGIIFVLGLIVVRSFVTTEPGPVPPAS